MNKRQLNGWVKIVDKLGDCVVQRTPKRVAGGGRKVRFGTQGVKERDGALG